MNGNIIRFSECGILSSSARETSNILACNEFTEKRGLVLTERQAAEIAAVRERSLKETGRAEFGGGVSQKLVRAFYDSPYIDGDNYAETLCELTEIFYLYKDETQDALSDDAVIVFMKNAFNGRCGGCTELLKNDELTALAKSLNGKRSGGSRL